ncbi:uncharacterized protein LOC111339738 isoform X1 [Stylophora pistillata]|uniref:uncharacterized protein LOC111339738 isoform X1 n=1 Tax=Stylophora pistillata TaxID=50429 RepID=UPI000C04E7F9|nr:uncharacterized protein LOC111339738 isoform X1 [Stylophora pistillata]XP_022802190.1 uncharacterized protein LOC111339738 isoform X1 [Stylophora pistillata]XP_022802191.1 uncharacterized protein LOC111339738 isoform X1 [Stylophora pistillata]
MSQENNYDRDDQRAGNSNSEGSPSTEKMQSSEQTDDSKVTKRHEKLQEETKKTFAEILHALPGGKAEENASHTQLDHHVATSNTHSMEEYHAHQDQVPRRVVDMASQEYFQESYALQAPEEQQLRESDANANQNAHYQHVPGGNHPMDYGHANVPIGGGSGGSHFTEGHTHEVVIYEGSEEPQARFVSQHVPGGNHPMDYGRTNVLIGGGSGGSHFTEGDIREVVIYEGSEDPQARSSSQHSIVFEVYTSVDAESVAVITADDHKMHLDQASPASGCKRHWINRAFCFGEQSFRYRYMAAFKRSMLTRVFNWLARKEENSCEVVTEESFRKSVAGSHRYEIFRFPSNVHAENRTFEGYLFFVEMLYRNGKDGVDFLSILEECRNLPVVFSRISSSDYSKLFKWIERVTNTSTKWYEAAYICSIIGQLVEKLKDQFGIFDRIQGKIADKLLVLLFNSHYQYIPPYNVEMIKSIAKLLVHASSRKGWLSFLSYFANLFEVDLLLRNAMNLPPASYSEEDFNQLIGLLVLNLPKNNCTKICEYVIEHCDFIYCLWHFYLQLSSNLPEVANTFCEKFSRRFCKLISPQITREKTDLLQRNYWKMTPAEMRGRLADRFVEALTVQIKEDRLDSEKVAMLKSYATDKNICSSNGFRHLVRSLAQKRNGDVFSALMVILNSKEFYETWRTWKKDEKRDICNSLLKSMFQFQGLYSKPRPQEKILRILEIERKICETYSLQEDQEMQAVLEECSINFLQEVNVKSIIDVFDDIEKSSQIMQSCYSSLLRNATKRSGTSTDGSLVKTLLNLLDVNAERSLQQDLAFVGARWELLIFLLELVELPPNQRNPFPIEEVMKRMVEVKDVWLFLLRTLQPCSELRNYGKIKTALTALHDFETAILTHKSRVGFLLELKEADVTTLAQFCTFFDSSGRNPQQEVDETPWRERIHAVWEKARNFQVKFWKMKKSIQFVLKVVDGIAEVSDAPELSQEINTRKEFSQKSLKEVLDSSYWGPLSTLVESAEVLNKLHCSKFFFSIARASLTDENGEFRVNSDSIPASQVMELLSNKGIERLQKACNPLFSKNSDLEIGDVHILLNEIKSSDALLEELSFISKYFRRPVVPAMQKMLISYLKYPVVQKKTKRLGEILKVFGYDETCFPPPVKQSLEEFCVPLHMKQITLKDLCNSMENETVMEVDDNMDKDLTDIALVLGESRELISFIEETVSEDMVVLIDVVEEYSDHFVSESTVSHLIDVHRFLRSIVKDKPPDPMAFLCRLKTCHDSLQGKQGMAAKIDECSRNVHSLRAFYTNVANRGEMTKEIIRNALRGGSYQLRRNDDSTWEVLLAYKKEIKYPRDLEPNLEGGNQDQEVGSKQDPKSDQDTTYRLSDLQDLRSRALLLVNIDSKHQNAETRLKFYAECSAAELKEFVGQVDRVMEILSLADELHVSGHPDYKDFWVKLDSSLKIEDEARNLTHKLEEWSELLRDMYNKYFFLNFFHPDQLWVLHDFFARARELDDNQMSGRRKVHDLLRFIQPSLSSEALDKISSHYSNTTKRGIEGDLQALGQAFDYFFLQVTTHETPEVPKQCLHGVVKPGELFVSVLEQRSTQTVHVVVSLFEWMKGAYPQPSEVIFCHPDTSWEEILRLLRRSFGSYKHTQRTTLHCLANVESLPNDMQFKLVTAIKHFQSLSNSKYLLSLVCRGGSHHHIVDQFAAGIHNVTGMTHVKLREKFKETLPQVFVVTSELPGLGKTEYIFADASRWEKGVVTVPISGPLSRRNLINQLASLRIKERDCIHLDIGEVDDPIALDTFLFELIVVGMVSSGTVIYHLPTKHVYIEIANTLTDWLRDSLPVTKCFKPIYIKFDEYKRYLVSQESSSPIQVVCNYLHVHDIGVLESNELTFSGPNKVKPLTPERCRLLLRKHFPSAGEISYNNVETFLRVFADQLLKFSASPFLKPSNLKAAFGGSHDVRTRFFRALLRVSRDFAARSVFNCKSVQAEAISDKQASDMLRQTQLSPFKTAEKMVSRVEGMIRWADNNHLLLLFQTQQELTISAFYRQLELVPPSVTSLCEIQGMKLVDYHCLSQRKLQEKLEHFAKESVTTLSHDDPSSKYALTPDNVLKMILILLRIRANIPVILMGETGCGKTSLVRYLAKTCDVPFRVFNLHAGITEDQIIHFIQEVTKDALSAEMRKRSFWVFLDEINTCDHLGKINEMICHRTIRGKPLPSNLVFLSACNPYRLRHGTILTSGLSEKVSTDEYSRLVYRVNPLPETMIDYVWDYGSISPEDEKAYIARMVEGVYNNRHRELLIDVLFAAQTYVRKVEKTPFCVSLRDVHRCIVLMRWFHEIQLQRRQLSSNSIPSQAVRSVKISLKIRSIVLALAHSYQSRFQTGRERDSFCKEMSRLIKKRKAHFPDEGFQAIVREEQEDYLSRMELPDGTAKNAALRENVFVILVCILNRIPVFVVGKPGCSKSLSMQVIRSNLRGKDSKDPFLKQLPQLYIVSHQGSESSTSEGILKVFEKARRYKVEGSNDILPVVLLDEIGLAEVSPFNPLKVLHSLLEPSEEKPPDVAVVGISNWCLDPAKMNRAVHLSRPEPDIDDLFQTGQSIREAQAQKRDTTFMPSVQTAITSDPYPEDYQLRCLATAYQEYQKDQRHENFHGLRDYYSLVKSLSSDHDGNLGHQYEENQTTKTQRALQRNFGGLPADSYRIQHLFLKHFQSKKVMEEIQCFPVTELICDNLHDRFARHMMIITNGDSAIGILDQTLGKLKREKVTIFGSRFVEDQSEEYNYNILSRIILCMERNCVLILRDLESIYGSLYDMLNQNYTVVGQKKNCRIALGPFSNSMCQVHDEFRCIVLVDEQRIDYTDPPFLNRFEKQLLRFSDVLNEDQMEVISCLENWAKEISTVPELESQFNESDMFMGFNKDTLPSLVLHMSKNREMTRHNLVEKCKEKLMWIATPDGVLRSLKSELSRKKMEEVDFLFKNYFEKPIHSGLRCYLNHVLGDLQTRLEKEDERSRGVKLLVMTHSNIHTNILQSLTCLGTCQAEKLSSYKSEKQLAKQLQKFWASDCNILVLQCKPDLDAPHMLVAKHLIENQRNTYLSSKDAKTDSPTKHVCLVVHVQRLSKARETDCPQWQFSFQSGWEQVAIDTLEEPMQPITELLEAQVTDLLCTQSFPFEEIANDQLWWCFTRIKYSSMYEPKLHVVRELVNWLKSSSVIMECFKKIVLRLLEKDESSSGHDLLATSSWLVKVASDRLALINSSTLVEAIKHHFIYLVQKPLAKIVYFLEKESAWPKDVLLSDEAIGDYLYVWTELLLNEEILRIEDIPESQGAESYLVPGYRHKLEFPFSSVFIRRVDKMKSLFLEDLQRVQLDEANINDNNELKYDVFDAQLQRFEPEIQRSVKQLFNNEYLQRISHCYVDDFLDLKTASFAGILSRANRINLSKQVVAEHIRIPSERNFARLITHLHCVFWMKESLLMSAFQLSVKCRDVVPVEIELLSPQFVKLFDKMMFKTPEETYPISVSSSLPQSESKENPGREFQSEDHAEDKSPKFFEILVETFCRALFPTDTVVKTSQGLRKWQRSVSLILSMVSRMQQAVPAFHFLRVCYDFVSLMIPEDSEESYYSLYMIGESGHGHASEGYLESQDCFNLINNQIDQLEKNQKNLDNLKGFRAIFYTRCIESNLDTPVRKCILGRISSSKDTTLIKVAAPVINKIFKDEDRICREERGASVFEEVLIDPLVLDDHPGLQDVHSALSSLTTETELDCPFVVLCCDLISEIGFPSIDLASTSGSESKCIGTLRRSTEILTKPSKEEEKNVLLVVCATAYLRSFLGSFARLTVKNPTVLKSDSQFTMLVREVQSVLSSNENQFAAVRTSQLRLFFLRELRKEMSLHAVKKIIREGKNLPAVQALKCHTDDQIFVCKLSFDPLSSITQNSLAKKALACLTQDENPNQEPMHRVLSSLHTSANQKIELAATLTRWIYLERSVRNLGESEEKAMECVNNGISGLPRPYVELLQRVTGKKDFQAQELCISPTSSSADVHRAALILHLCMVLVSNYIGTKSEFVAFISYLVNPRRVKETFILGAANNPHSPFGISQCYSSFQAKKSLHLCPCGTFFALNEVTERSEDSIGCPECKQSDHSKVEQDPDRRKSKICSATMGYTFLPPTEDVSSCVRDLNPTDFRILHLLLHAALYGGLALGLWNAESLLGSTAVDNGEGGCVVKEFYQHIIKDLAVLSELFNCKEEEVIQLLHRVIEKVTPNVSDANHCLTEGKRRLWEKEFSETIRPLVSEFGMKRRITNPHDPDSLSRLEKQIEECDKPQFKDKTERRSHVPRLFRVTSTKSFDSLRSYYMHAEENLRESHPLVGLFLDFHGSLELVTHLNNLLKWTRMVDTQLSRRKSRIEASKTLIEELMGDDMEREVLENAFKSFQTSWEKIRPSVIKAGDADMPHITRMSPISLSLVEKKGDGKYLCSALKILQGIQNDFVVNVLSIAASGKCGALTFLERGEGIASVQMVHLQDAQKKQIIHYQWSNEILTHSQHNTEYGQGKEIVYDIGRIEKELAVRFLLGKCYLSTEDGLREFMFAKELFHACKGILDELEQIVPQQPLTEQVQGGLRTLKSRSLKGVQNLLGHMEIVLCLLKKHQFGNPSEPLVEFTDRWLAESRPFPKSLLPEPHKDVLLTHVVSLYEFLEDLLADSATEGIHDMYRKEFLSDIRDQMKGIAGNCIVGPDNIPLTSVITALKRFIFRYLSSEEMRPDPGLPLLEHMLEQSLWPMEIMTERKGLSAEQWKDAIKSVVPEVLTLGQIHAVLNLYQNQLEISEERKQPARNQTARRPTMSRSKRTRAGMGVSFS